MQNQFLNKPNYIRIYGHRGARGDIVENSIEGFKYTFGLGIKAIEFDDKTFDPERHEAISVIEDDSLEQNTIIDVVQKGYTIMDRILRPAKVVVSKKSKIN